MLSRAALKFREEFEYGKTKDKNKCCMKCIDNETFKIGDSEEKCVCYGMHHLQGTLFNKSETMHVSKDHVCTCFRKKGKRK